jgi:ATP-dependent protease HslVU (ClpYQ) peptidase subunit
MTCIIGLADKGNVYIGADSASVNVDALVSRPTNIPKVFKRGPFLIGYTTSFRMGQILEHWLEVPVQTTANKNDQEYMVKEFAESVRSLFKMKGFSTNDKGGTFLVGYSGKLYSIYSDYQINEKADQFDAVGCGDEFALGAMAALKNLKPTQRIKKSLEVAAYFSAGVMPPFRVKYIKS